MYAYHPVLVLIFQPLSLETLLIPYNTKAIFPCPKVTRISHSLRLNITCSVNEIQVIFHQLRKKPFLMCSCGVFSWFKVSVDVGIAVQSQGMLVKGETGKMRCKLLSPVCLIH